MPDFCDLGADVEQRQRDAALAAHADAMEAERRREAVMATLRPAVDPDAPRACMGCGEAIDPRRIAALPMTGHCTACAEAAARRAR